MNLIKNAFVYHASLPAGEKLSELLSNLAYRPLGREEVERDCFVPNPLTNELITPLAGGYTFTFRRDSKDIPASVVEAELEKRIKRIENDDGRAVGRKEKAELKYEVILNMLEVAFVRTTFTNVFYNEERRILVVPASSGALADSVTSQLLNLLKSEDLKTGLRLIQIDQLQQKLTGALFAHIESIKAADWEAPSPFGQFSWGTYVQLKNPYERKGNKATFETNGAHDPSEGIIEAVSVGCQVERIELHNEEFTFRLTKDALFKSVKFHFPEELEDDGEDAPGYWRVEASRQLSAIIDAVDSLTETFGKDEGQDQGSN